MDRRCDNRRTGNINIYICSEGPEQDCNSGRRPRFAGGINPCDESDEWLRKATRKDCEDECTCFRSPAVKLDSKKKTCKMPKSKKDCCKGKCKPDCKALKKEKKKSKKCKDVTTGRARAVGKRVLIQSNQCQENTVETEMNFEPPTCCCEPIQRDVCCCDFETTRADKNCTCTDDKSVARKNCLDCSKPGLECICKPEDVGYEQCTCKLRTMMRNPNRALLCHNPDFRRFSESYRKVINEFKRKVNLAKKCRVCRETCPSPPRCFEESGHLANEFQARKRRKGHPVGKLTCNSVTRLPSKIQLAKNVNLIFKRPRPKCYYCKKSPCKCDVFKKNPRQRRRKVHAHRV